MNLQKTYASWLSADLAAAEGRYAKLLGRGPDHRPMPTLLHWELSDEGGLMLSSSEEIAARGAIFLYVDDLDAERRRLDELGIALGDDNEGEYSTLAQVRDPDGNLITFAYAAQATLPAGMTVPTSATNAKQTDRTGIFGSALQTVVVRRASKSDTRRTCRSEEPRAE